MYSCVQGLAQSEQGSGVKNSTPLSKVHATSKNTLLWTGGNEALKAGA
jgi:hypothetical protein